MRWPALGLGSLALLAQASCAAQDGTHVADRSTTRYQQPYTGTLIGGTGDQPETDGKNPEASFQQPSFGTGAPGYIKPGSGR